MASRSRRLNLTIFSVLLFTVAFPCTEAGEDKKIEVVEEANVHCQSCDHFGSRSLIGDNSIPSAKVSVTCKSHKGHVSYYKVFEADENGYVFAALEGFKVQHYILDHPLPSCHVKPVWSPTESCSLLSNENYGLNGAPLRYENKRLKGSKYEAVIYPAGTLAFRPSHCSQTSHC